MGRLQDRMAEDLRLRNFSPATRRNYLLCARKFVAFFMRSPEELAEPEIRQFLLHQLEVKRLSYSTYRQIYAALKFLYTVTLQRPWEVDPIPFPRQRQWPLLLVSQRVGRLISNVPTLEVSRPVHVLLWRWPAHQRSLSPAGHGCRFQADADSCPTPQGRPGTPHAVVGETARGLTCLLA